MVSHNGPGVFRTDLEDEIAEAWLLIAIENGDEIKEFSNIEKSSHVLQSLYLPGYRNSSFQISRYLPRDDIKSMVHSAAPALHWAI